MDAKSSARSVVTQTLQAKGEKRNIGNILLIIFLMFVLVLEVTDAKLTEFC